MNDAELVQRLLASEGQDQAIAEALVRGQMDRIARLCRSMVRNEQAAAELAQEALVRLYTSIPRFRGECKWQEGIPATFKGINTIIANSRKTLGFSGRSCHIGIKWTVNFHS